MGKRVLAGLLATAAIFVLSRPQSAQEAPPQPADTFKPGKFFTQDDYDHLKAALEAINLTPDDLKYEKKHKPNDTLRLKVCDAALDDPLGLPLVTEAVSEGFGRDSAGPTRFQRASQLLDSPKDRWSKDELGKDRADREALDAKAQEFEEANDPAKARAVRDAAYEERLFGGKAESVQKLPEGWAEIWQTEMRALGQELYVPTSALFRSVDSETKAKWNDIGRSAPGQIFESPNAIPYSGSAAEREDLFNIIEPRVPHDAVRAAEMLVASIREKWVVGYSNIIDRLDNRREPGFDSTVEGVTGGVFAAWDGPLGKVVIGGEGPNIYEGDDFIIIIDLGGDDTYKGRVACGIGLDGQAPISVVLDLGGNDRYEGEDFTQGFGFLGVGILHDLGGGDDYYKSRFCAQGCGLCGYGELYDDGGDDIYLADSGAQGAGCFGYGHLIDKAGNDIYRGARYVQAFAQVMGVGVLTDGDGNDLYYAGGKYLHQPLWNDRYQSLSQGFAIGNRNDRGTGTGGGVALLLDEGSGNDVYQCDIYGQGSSYWYSLGMLVDRGGNDTYTLGQYGQGAGIHLSAAILYDEAGNDTYSMGVGLGQGAAHDWAVGWQIDRAGNDSYQGSGQGMGLNFSVGILLDCAGDDSHGVNSEGSIGKGHNNDISILMDLAGTDSYGPKEIKDGEFTRRGPHQIVYDVPQGWFPAIDTSTWPTKQAAQPDKAFVQHILIAWDGTGIDTQKAARTKEQAFELAHKVMKQARTKGADWKQLQADYNEDCAANPDGTNTHNKYTASADAKLVKSFRDMSLSLGVGQINICESKYGYHIIKRLE